MVLVLLRVLEYYQGIMLLTTNRMTSLDVAVQSRVHLAVAFKDLTSEGVCSIFEENLKHCKEEVEDMKSIMSWIKREAPDLDLNGREIRNLISSAQALARSEKELLTQKHIDDVYKITARFKKTLQETLAQSRQDNYAPRQ